MIQNLGSQFDEVVNKSSESPDHKEANSLKKRDGSPSPSPLSTKRTKSDDSEATETKKHTDIGGGIYMRNSVLRAAKTRPDIEDAAADLISAVFDKDTLAKSSLIGKVSNFHKKNNLSAKPQLDELKVKAIEEFLLQYFGETPKNRRLIRARITKACNAASKAPRRT
ncbi:uncharacterized protein LOC107043559 [Diachasma alloeum]|uniref:uncharacterized protein LOC107043559 n=1 Tax=Diachasma alloeum TaxID=454923 RepID=UPI0007382D30|nr:uncharacterized protein LOC107043559 [Diachasma alloeum]